VLDMVNNSSDNKINITQIYHLLNEVQKQYQITIPVYLELKLIGLVEKWALGEDWQNLCKNTSLDEGDLVRLLRRTIDLLSQIPHTPGLSSSLIKNAEKAVIQLKRFPV
jgi:superfamily II RNA helicase